MQWCIHVFGLNWSMNSCLVKHTTWHRCWTSCKAAGNVKASWSIWRPNAAGRQQQVGTKLGSAHVCCYSQVRHSCLPAICSPIPLHKQGWKTWDTGYGNCCIFSHMLFKKAFSLLLSVTQKWDTAGSLLAVLIVSHGLSYLQLHKFK